MSSNTCTYLVFYPSSASTFFLDAVFLSRHHFGLFVWFFLSLWSALFLSLVLCTQSHTLFQPHFILGVHLSSAFYYLSAFILASHSSSASNFSQPVLIHLVFFFWLCTAFVYFSSASTSFLSPAALFTFSLFPSFYIFSLYPPLLLLSTFFSLDFLIKLL